jgi:hypothetical protein
VKLPNDFTSPSVLMTASTSHLIVFRIVGKQFAGLEGIEE